MPTYYPIDISIHVPREGDDIYIALTDTVVIDFNPRPP